MSSDCGPDADRLVKILAGGVERARAAGVTYPVLIAGRQGIGKSRILAAFAVELRRRGFEVWYDVYLPPAGSAFDYVVLDDVDALLAASGRRADLRKIEIAVRSAARHGYALAADAASDVYKFFKPKAAAVYLLYTPREAPESWQSRMSEECEECDVLACGRRCVTPFCIAWRGFKYHNDDEWRREYERVQAEKAALARKLYEEFARLAAPGDAVLRFANVMRQAAEALYGTGSREDVRRLLEERREVAVGGVKYADVEGDTVRIYAPAAHAAGATLAGLAEALNKRLGRSAAALEKTSKMRIAISLEDLLNIF